MSADNWRVCPKCLAKEEKNHGDLSEKARQLYGKVPSDEWIDMISEAQKEVELEDTLREDWELKMKEDGEFYINYCCSCVECNFQFEYKYTERVKIG
jgi:hypothetical protein